MLIFATTIIILFLFIRSNKLFSSSVHNILCNITGIIIIVIIFSIIHVKFSPVIYADSFVQDMDNGHIVRTPLLQPGQTIETLTHGLYPVTGGHVNIGFLGKGNVTKVIGIMVNNYPTTLQGWNYQPGNQPFNMNFAKVLYELRAAGKNTCSYSSLDYYYSGRDLVQANLNSQYLRGFATSRGLSVDFGELKISSKILNALAEQEN